MQNCAQFPALMLRLSPAILTLVFNTMKIAFEFRKRVRYKNYRNAQKRLTTKVVLARYFKLCGLIPLHEAQPTSCLVPLDESNLLECRNIDIAPFGCKTDTVIISVKYALSAHSSATHLTVAPRNVSFRIQGNFWDISFYHSSQILRYLEVVTAGFGGFLYLNEIYDWSSSSWYGVA